ncbi:MAG: nucleotidyltransferase family protein [Burkholderiaceae bacterium]|nr:nucleotidyltransferase family protein [Burkholderiaceae bacterium]
MSSGPVIIVLAAGLGSRFQDAGHKLSQPLGVSSVLGSTLAQAMASQLPLVVVTTEALVDEAARFVARQDIVVLEAASGRPIEDRGDLRALNARLGMGASIAAGVSARSNASGWLVLPGDMPLLQSVTLQKVASALRDHAVAYAQHLGRRGHPVGFSAELYSELIHLQGDQGARRLVSRYPAQAIEVDDPGVLVDVDTVTDLAQVRAMWARAAVAPG